MMYTIRKTANEIILDMIIKTFSVCLLFLCVIVYHEVECTALCVPKMNSRCQHLASYPHHRLNRNILPCIENIFCLRGFLS